MEISALENSRQSSFRSKIGEPLAPEPLEFRDPFFRGGLRAVFTVELFAERGTRSLPCPFRAAVRTPFTHEE